jgi:hypothetical protein
MRLYPPGFLSLSASVACERFGFFLLCQFASALPQRTARIYYCSGDGTTRLLRGCHVCVTAACWRDDRRSASASCALPLSGIWSLRRGMHYWLPRVVQRCM